MEIFVKDVAQNFLVIVVNPKKEVVVVVVVAFENYVKAFVLSALIAIIAAKMVDAF